MRCRFCGWDSPDGIEKCEKCGKPLGAEATDSLLSEVHDRPTTRQPEKDATSLLKKTILESNIGNISASVPDSGNECPKCGYKLENGVCPSCGYTGESNENVENEPTHIDSKKTVRPNRKGEKNENFSLTPISEKNGQPEGNAIHYDKNEIILKRENTDPNNPTITSQQQAMISQKNGKWSILDQSEFRTTFVQANRNIELQNGDLILLGNQLYRFDITTE